MQSHHQSSFRDFTRELLPLPRIDTPPGPNLYSSTAFPLARQNPRQRVLIHQILPSLPLLAVLGFQVLLLILRQDQIVSPSAPTPSTFRPLPFLVRRARRGLRDAIDVSAVVPLEVLFQMQFD